MVYTQKEVNLHTHTFYCHHAKGTAADMVSAAKDKGLKVLGLSDHAPLRNQMGGTARMDYCDLVKYTNDVKELQGKDSALTVMLGAECEVLKEEKSLYEDEMLGQLGYDYLIMGIHFVNDEMGEHYIGRYDGMRKYLRKYVDLYNWGLSTGLFLFGAHPDLFAASFPVWDDDAKAASKDIIQCAKDLNMPLELNDYAFRKKPIGNRRPYSVDEFWEMALAYDVPICTNSDAHRPEDIVAKGSYELAEKLGIKFVNWDIDGKSIKFVR